MTDNIKSFLHSLGYEISNKAQNIIKQCDAWYAGDITKFHERVNVNGIPITMKTVNFGKRCCADDANLCEIVEINASKNSEKFEAINDILAANRFDVMYRRQLELMSADGTVGCYVRIDNAEVYGDGTVKNGDIRLNYCDAANIYPITIVNDEIIECAFAGDNIKGTKKETVLVVFTLNDNNTYNADTFFFVDNIEDTSRRTSLALGDVKPFAIMRTAEVNNIKDMEGYGLPKLYNSIPILQMLDLAYNILFGDLDKGDKIVFINELLACIQTDNDGRPYLTAEQKKLFVMLGEKLPDQPNIIYEYNPVLRIDEVTKIFETCLSLLSMTFGFGTKKYTFENGQIKSATEYIGEKQDSMQELNKQRKEATDYITGIVKAVRWFANSFNGGSFDDEDIEIEFDDSYITDRAAKLERMRDDAMSFDIPMLKVWYLMDAYNLAEEEAKALVMDSEQNENMNADGEEIDS